MPAPFLESSESLLKHHPERFADAASDDADDADGDGVVTPCRGAPRGTDLLKRVAAEARTWNGIKLFCVGAVSLVVFACAVFVAAKYLARSARGCECGLSTTESLLGNVAWQEKVLEQDDRFVTTDPGEIDGRNTTQIWDDIYPSAWIAVPDPSRVGFGGGVNMRRHGEDPSAWDAKAEGFSVAVMHQVHCVAVIKHSFMVYREDKTCRRDVDAEHIDHCVEYLRQAIMCHGDMTLERPSSQTYPQGTTGWGNVHRCRDWDQLVSVVRKHAIVRGQNGWVRAA
ncbi:hypothetical protein E4U41_004355 [Claviceps citrina]|nr:hypothetical protein E4U41_004355 [Claviceps citrina]